MSKYFTYEGDPRLACPCGSCFQSSMDDAFMAKLDQLREDVGFPLIVSSGYRCPAYNEQVSKTGLNGPHTTGRAVDLAVSYWHAFAVIRSAAVLGFTGIGVKQHGTGRFIHLDDLPATSTRSRPRIWSYP